MRQLSDKSRSSRLANNPWEVTSTRNTRQGSVKPVFERCSCWIRGQSIWDSDSLLQIESTRSSNPCRKRGIDEKSTSTRRLHLERRTEVRTISIPSTLFTMNLRRASTRKRTVLIFFASFPAKNGVISVSWITRFNTIESSRIPKRMARWTRWLKASIISNIAHSPIWYNSIVSSSVKPSFWSMVVKSFNSRSLGCP